MVCEPDGFQAGVRFPNEPLGPLEVPPAQAGVLDEVEPHAGVRPPSAAAAGVRDPDQSGARPGVAPPYGVRPGPLLGLPPKRDMSMVCPVTGLPVVSIVLEVDPLDHLLFDQKKVL